MGRACDMDGRNKKVYTGFGETLKKETIWKTEA